MLHELVLANSHVFTEFEDSEESPKMAFLHYVAAVMWAHEPLEMTIYMYI